MIAFVAQDMGGANLVLHHAKFTKENKKIFAFGPAKKLCNLLHLENYLTVNPMDNCDLVIAGANFQNSIKTSDLLLKDFESKGVKINGYLDGWEFYQKRFTNIIVHNYLVTDEYALRLAELYYPSKIKLIENFYLNQVRLDLNKLGLMNLVTVRNYVLYLTQPNILNIRNKFNFLHNQDCICEDLWRIFTAINPDHVIVRDHSRLDSSECIKNFELITNNEIEKSSASVPLAHDLSKCSIVCGPPNQALYIAQQLGYKTLSTKRLPDEWMGPNFMVLN